MTPAITSRRNRRIVATAALDDVRHRRREGRTLVEGPHLLADAVTAGFVVPVVYRLEDDDEAARLGDEAGAEVFTVSHAVLERVAQTSNPRGPVAEVVVPPALELHATDTLVLWDIAEPGNVGTLIRTAAALGFQVAVSAGADPWSPKAVRAGAGGHFRCRLVEAESIGAFGRAGLRLVSFVVRGGVAPDVALAGDDPVALLLGNEAHGLDPTLVAASTSAVSIGMVPGVESLNVAATGAIAMYERRRLSTIHPGAGDAAP